MEKVIAAFDARRKFGEVLNAVTVRGDRFVVERHGEAVAAVVPMHVYEQWKRQRDAFFAKWEEVAERVDLPEEQAMEAALEVVRMSREAG
jgi:prevent-host-death family protein